MLPLLCLPVAVQTILHTLLTVLHNCRTSGAAIWESLCRSTTSCRHHFMAFFISVHVISLPLWHANDKVDGSEHMRCNDKAALAAIDTHHIDDKNEGRPVVSLAHVCEAIALHFVPCDTGRATNRSNAAVAMKPGRLTAINAMSASCLIIAARHPITIHELLHDLLIEGNHNIAAPSQIPACPANMCTFRSLTSVAQSTVIHKGR